MVVTHPITETVILSMQAIDEGVLVQGWIIVMYKRTE